MKTRDTITKIALGVGIAALLFSIVTVVRSIINGSGVLMASIVLIGTAIVVVICAVMLYVQKKYDAYDAYDDEEEEDSGAASSEEAENDLPLTADTDSCCRPDEEEQRVLGSTKSAPAQPPARTAADRDREIEAEVDRIIAELEKEASYDLHSFES